MKHNRLIQFNEDKKYRKQEEVKYSPTKGLNPHIIYMKKRTKVCSLMKNALAGGRLTRDVSKHAS